MPLVAVSAGPTEGSDVVTGPGGKKSHEGASHAIPPHARASSAKFRRTKRREMFRSSIPVSHLARKYHLIAERHQPIPIGNMHSLQYDLRCMRQIPGDAERSWSFVSMVT